MIKVCRENFEESLAIGQVRQSFPPSTFVLYISENEQLDNCGNDIK